MDFTAIWQFSHSHCIAICGALVPLNVLATLSTLIVTGLQRSNQQVRGTAVIASLFALLMVLHVWTWLAVGVVRAPTFILFGLGTSCLVTNLWAVSHRPSLLRLLQQMVNWFVNLPFFVGSQAQAKF